jgi:hypothetical protein
MSGLSPAACAKGVKATVRSGTAVCQGSANRRATVMERVTGVALREHGLAGGNLELVELADEASQDLAGEVGEKRDGPQCRDDRVHRHPVAGTLDAANQPVKASG